MFISESAGAPFERTSISPNMAFLKTVTSAKQLDDLLNARGDGLVVIDFWATWCPPCHAMAPLFEQLSNQYRHATFVKIDTDANPDIMQKYSVRAMPTFVLTKNKAVVDTVVGADPQSLATKVQANAGPAPASAASSSDPTAKVDATTAGDVSLLEYLESAQVNCLNESDDHGIKSIVSTKGKNTSNSYLLSDADEQLLINIYFNQTVRVRSISIQTKEPLSGPKKIKLFINKPSLGFEDVEDAEEPEASQIVELAEDVVKDGKRIPLRFVRFQSVNSLHIFVSSNHGGEDETRIDALDFFGLPVQVTKNLSELRNAHDHEH